MADHDLPDEAPHMRTTGPASTSYKHAYSRIHTRVFAPSVALKHTLTHKDRIAEATVAYQRGLDEKQRGRGAPSFMVVVWIPESTFSRITRITP